MQVRFDEFSFDMRSGCLRRNGQPRQLTGPASEVLRVLLEQRPELVTKEELLRRVWRGAAVEEGNLTVAIADLRDALDDDAQKPRFVRTFHRRGYAFVAEAAEIGQAGKERPGVASIFVLEWAGQRLVLSEGENIVGRNPVRCSACIDEPRVSGRHARIVVSGDAATIEDLESTNHTFIRGVRVTSPTLLTSGDVIRLGGPDLTFRRTDVATVRVRRNASR
jgi:DNA-binding winged helix-turn-helix (wHTH) protein